MVTLCLSFSLASAYDFDGEELKYELYWTIFHIADAKAKAEKVDKDIYRFEGKVSTAGVARWFKKIVDRGYSIWDGRKLVPIKTFISQKEGDYIREKIYIYDFGKKEVTFIKRKPGKKDQVRKGKIELFPFQDMVSAIYYFRKYGKFKVGEETRFPICIDGKFYVAKVKVLSEERIDTPFGKVDTFKCSPSRELTLKGSFERRGDAFVWFTKDERHIPVKFVGKVKIGSISAVLVSAKGKGFQLRRREEKMEERIREKFLEGNYGF